MARKIVTKKSVAKPEAKETPRHSFVEKAEDAQDDEQYIKERNRHAREHGIDNSKPADKISRVVHIQFSAGDDMRDVSIHEFTQKILDAVGVTRYGEPGIHGTRMNGYYILDGKMCHEVDYDPEKENFKDGRTPPEYAGGPKPFKPPVKPAVPAHQVKHLTADEINSRYPRSTKGEVRHHKWSESHVKTGRPDVVINEEANAKHVADKLRRLRAKKKSESASQVAPRKRVVVKKNPPEPPKKRVVVKRSK